MFQFSDEYVKQLLDQIYNGTITMYELPESLYNATADYLKKAVYEGFGGDLNKFVNTPDYALLTELRENIYMFSAAKTYQQVKDISSQLVDGDRVRTREEFNKIGSETFDKWNNDWGKSEYNTAIASASMASKWNDIEKHKDILPNLRYSTIGDACDICAPLNDLTLPVDAPEWDSMYPPNHFNCMCVVLQEEADVPVTPDEDKDDIMGKVDPEMAETFKMNSGRDKVIFSEDHPYFDVEKGDKEFAKNNFDLPIPPPASELDEVVFQPATDLMDVTERLKLAGVQDINIKGLDIDLANGVLNAIEKESSFGNFRLAKLDTYNKSNSHVAIYSPSNNSISINLTNVKKFEKGIVKTYEEQLKEFADLKKQFMTDYLGNPKYKQSTVNARIESLNQRIREVEQKISNGEMARPWTISSTAETKEERILLTMTHELGHYRHFKTIGESTYFPFDKKGSITEYGRTNNKEYFAEWFTYYRKHGEEGVPNPLLKLFKKIDNGE